MASTNGHGAAIEVRGGALDADINDRSGLSERQRLMARISEKIAAKGVYRLASVELRRATPDGRASKHGPEVHSWHAEEDPEMFELRGAGRLTSEIFAAAEENAYGFEAKVFVVCLVDQRQGVSTFVLRDVQSEEQALGGSGDASNRAVIAQLMTQNERLMQHCVKLSAGACEQMRLMTIQFGEHARQLLTDRQSMLIENDKLRSKQFERETARILTESSEKRKDEAAKRLLGMTQDAFGHFKAWLASKGKTDVKETADAAKKKQDAGKELTPSEMFSMLWMALSGDQITAVVEVFSEDKQAAFIPIIEKIAAKEAQDDQICAFMRTLTLAEVTKLRSICNDEQARLFGGLISASEGKR